MKNLKRYILITFSLLLAAILGAVLVWYFLIFVPIKDAQDSVNSAYKNAEETSSEFKDSVKEKLSGSEDDATVTSDIRDTDSNTQNTAPIIIQKSSLPEAQQSVLTTFGFGEEIVITPEMQVCAEVKLGANRLAEIVDGATPSFSEATSLVTCLKNN